MKPLLSIILPCKDEVESLSNCLDSILENDFSNQNLELLIIDGLSTDGTLGIISQYTNKHSFIRYIKNECRSIPSALNIGLKQAKGDILMRMDAHTTYSKSYISRCIRLLKVSDAKNVGGIVVSQPRNLTVMAKAICYALSNAFGVGNSSFRVGIKKDSYVDTVPFFCCFKELFEQIGFFDERVLRSEDVEMNRRIRRIGGKIILSPDILAYYHPRADLLSFLKHNYLNGVWVMYPLKFIPHISLRVRHFVPFTAFMLFTLLAFLSIFTPIVRMSLLTLLSTYLVINLGVSLFLSIKKRDYRLALALPAAFSVLHIGYGFGTVVGFAGLVCSKSFWTNQKRRFKLAPAGTRT